MNRAQPELHQRLMISSPLDEGERIEVRGFSQFRKAATKPSPNPLPCKGRRESIWCAFAVTREWSIKILGNRLFAIAAIIGVGLWFLGIPAISGGLGANPPEKLLHRTGEIAIWTLGAAGLLPRVRPSTKGEGHERRYFYGSVWAVCFAQPALGILWRTLARSRTADAIELVVFASILVTTGLLARRGMLPRTRRIVPGELAISD